MLIAWMAIGFILYFLSSKQRNAMTQEEREAALFEHAADHADED